MSDKRKRRRKRGPIAALTAFIAAAAIMCALVLCLIYVLKGRIIDLPVEYTDEICAAAYENGIPAPYIAAVIMAESSYDPDAVSSVGARGLMQIMPETGAWIAERFEGEYSDDMLFTPEVSIRFGAWYLGFLMDRYDGDMRCATAAYHAGQGTVDRWLADSEYSADGVTLDKIGYDSTRLYVDRVLKYYEYYAKVYQEDENN